jgi:hypothetical protein
VIASGSVSTFFLFDVAEAIDLDAVRTTVGAGAAPATLADKSAGPPRMRYEKPPIVADAAAFGIGTLDRFQVRVKLFDYGVISLMLTQPFAGTWAEFVTLGQQFIENDAIERRATEACQTVIARLRPAIRGLRTTMLSEDYLVFAATAFDSPCPADQLVEKHGVEIAQLVRGERSPLSWQEVDEVLRHRLSYLANDLVVPAWNAVFIADTEAGVQAATEIFEFANSQLLEFRYYDALLETELEQIYAQLQAPSRWARLLGRRHKQATRRLHSLFIEVNDLTDHMQNAVRIGGDVYAARLFNLVASRLGVTDWKSSVKEKMKTLDDIHRFAVEQTNMSQANLMELTIVAILVLELALFFTGQMK